MKYVVGGLFIALGAVIVSVGTVLSIKDNDTRYLAEGYVVGTFLVSAGLFIFDRF